jgi:hypothetical protein
MKFIVRLTGVLVAHVEAASELDARYAAAEEWDSVLSQNVELEYAFDGTEYVAPEE